VGDRSRYEWRRPGKLDRQRSTAVYDGQTAMTSTPNAERNVYCVKLTTLLYSKAKKLIAVHCLPLDKWEYLLDAWCVVPCTELTHQCCSILISL